MTFGGAGADYGGRWSSVLPRVADRDADSTFRGADLHGLHNFSNAAAAIAAARWHRGSSQPRSKKVCVASVRSASGGWRPLSGRHQRASALRRFKATNMAEAAVTALRGLGEARGVLIAGRAGQKSSGSLRRAGRCPAREEAGLRSSSGRQRKGSGRPWPRRADRR